MAIPSAAIEPNSTEYGDRQTLEAGLSQMGGAAPVAPGGEAMPPSTTIPAQGNPFSAMLSGELSPGNDPLSSGMSVGPGSGPARPPGPTDNDTGNKLKMIAEQSSSPTLRRLAWLRLRAMQRGMDNGG